MKQGAYDYINKPFTADEVLLTLRKAEEREALRRENRSLKAAILQSHRFEEMLGKSSAIKSVFRTVETVAEYKTTVLIEGDSGTGKELVAGAIHSLSKRREKNYIRLNCAAIPETLLESELFGHEKGAFTGALRTKPGRVEEADGGTIFLARIRIDAELDPGAERVQGSLARCLLQIIVTSLGDRSFSVHRIPPLRMAVTQVSGMTVTNPDG